MTGVAARLVAAARERGVRVVTAESCTGGLVAGAITDIAGASAVLDCGFITYSDAAKTEMLGVPPGLIDEHGAVSEPVARAMAEGARKRSGSTLAVAVTGIAGPGGSAYKPEGRVCFALAGLAAGTSSETVDFGAIGRERVRAESVAHALALLLAALDAQ